MSTCVQVFFYSDFPMATKDTLKKFYKSVATEISFPAGLIRLLVKSSMQQFI